MEELDQKLDIATVLRVQDDVATVQCVRLCGDERRDPAHDDDPLDDDSKKRYSIWL